MRGVNVIVILLLLRVVLVFTASCLDKPGQPQCLAYNNRFILPRNTKCNPLKSDCRMGDLVDPNVATCTLKYSGNIQYSLAASYGIGFYFCIPEIQSVKTAPKMTVSVDRFEPKCRGVVKRGRKKFTCGSKGTRCVCYAPKGRIKQTENICRCQYFIDYCVISKVCSHPKAKCLTRGNTVTCTCSRREKTCTTGINQCTTDPSVCTNRQECIELYDDFSSWTIGAKQSNDGYACVNKQDIQLLHVSTKYCSVTTSYNKAEEKADNHIDVCCFRQLTCGTKDNTIKGNILSYRPCYCNTLFRNCLIRYSKHIAYRDIVAAVIRTINQQKTCQMNEQNHCDPRKPKSCEKGDLINTKIAHCKVNCKSGPLLPIGQRMCSIRQCKPPQHVPGVRILDVPNQRTSSLCKAVHTLPFLCGKEDTRCVCDSRPSSLSFTDRCRCQYWPLEI